MVGKGAFSGAQDRIQPSSLHCKKRSSTNGRRIHIKPIRVTRNPCKWSWNHPDWPAKTAGIFFTPHALTIVGGRGFPFLSTSSSSPTSKHVSPPPIAHIILLRIACDLLSSRAFAYMTTYTTRYTISFSHSVRLGQMASQASKQAEAHLELQWRMPSLLSTLWFATNERQRRRGVAAHWQIRVINHSGHTRFLSVCLLKSKSSCLFPAAVDWRPTNKHGNNSNPHLDSDQSLQERKPSANQTHLWTIKYQFLSSHVNALLS